MNERQSTIFTIIVREYIQTATPVSSQQVLNSSNLNISSATVRNDMVELEKQGLVIQPHTSAGRIPTEVGYQVFVENHLSQNHLPKKYVIAMQNYLADAEAEYTLKFLAKGLASISGLLVFVAFKPNDIYYTGLSQLLSQPEFVTYDRVYDISKVVDHLDDVIHGIFHKISDDVDVFIGKDNPFSPDTSVLISKYTNGNETGIFGFMGPMRMDYDKHIALLRYAQEVLK